MTPALDHSKTITCPACGEDWPPAKAGVYDGRWVPLLIVTGVTRTHSIYADGCNATFFVEEDFSLTPLTEAHLALFDEQYRTDLALLIRGAITE